MNRCAFFPADLVRTAEMLNMENKDNPKEINQGVKGLSEIIE